MANFTIMHPKSSRGRLSRTIKSSFVGLGVPDERSEFTLSHLGLCAFRCRDAAGSNSKQISVEPAESQSKGEDANDMMCRRGSDKIGIDLALDYEIALTIDGIKRTQVYQNFVVCLRAHVMTNGYIVFIGAHYFGFGYMLCETILNARDPFQCLTNTHTHA